MSRAEKFLAAMRAIEETLRLVEELEDGLFGHQRRELIATKVQLRQAERRLIALASLSKPNGRPSPMPIRSA